MNLYIYENTNNKRNYTDLSSGRITELSLSQDPGMQVNKSACDSETTLDTAQSTRVQARACVNMPHGSRLSRLTHQGTEIRARASQGAARIRRRRLRRRRPLAKASLAHGLLEARGGVCAVLRPTKRQSQPFRGLVGLWVEAGGKRRDRLARVRTRVRAREGEGGGGGWG